MSTQTRTTVIGEERLQQLRERSKQVREQVAADRQQIEAEGRDVIASAVASGRLVKFLFRPEEQQLLEAVDRYAVEHHLQSREQVIRAALGKLLSTDSTAT